ncbi:aminomethyl transferase family protein [Pseudomonas lalucatii]|nr:aminomethyl transferase family protein [Pseudomonas lalucatii]
MAGAPVRALRVNYVGELGWELHHPIEYQLGLYDALVEAGAEFGMRNFGTRAMDSLRLEKAYPMWGHELTCENTPLEAKLGFFVKTDARDFVGREALVQQREQGVKVQLAYLEVDAEGPMPSTSNRCSPVTRWSAWSAPVATATVCRRAWRSPMCRPIRRPSAPRSAC